MTRRPARRLVRVALFAALLAVLAPLSLPLGPIPLSAATLVWYLAASLLPRWDGPLAVLLYVALGTIGLPVFSGFSGGAQILFGPTGGYLWGYLLGALLIALSRRLSRGAQWVRPLVMLAGTLACYALGTLWYAALTGISPVAALGLCVLPFLPGDLLKIALACAILTLLEKRSRPFSVE